LFSQCLIVDDASPCLPEWNDLSMLDKTTNEDYIAAQKNILRTFPTHLGRPSTWNYPGWFRSYGFAAKYAKKFNFKKVIHIESDAYLLSQRLFDYINQLDKGWSSLWSNRYNFPETAIQIICEDQINSYFNFSTKPYNSTYINNPIEVITPFTNINKRFIGDRYSEFRADIPSDADFCCQFPIDWELRSPCQKH